jgi:hypothetical protein
VDRERLVNEVLILMRAIEAARHFDRLKGVSWRGDYIRSDDGWIAAWVREVN